ncbi:MAG: aldehyde dehydrogenase family protein, partial [Actinobacteria bacterium]|nr:aldehyde dehydrogenase family protein [Actinomycetota bacterium]
MDAGAVSSPVALATRTALDSAITDLRQGAHTWSHLTLGQRAKLLERIRVAVVAVAAEWADVAATSKGLEPGHPLRGEEWLAGPYAMLMALDAYRVSLLRLAKDESPLSGVKTDVAPGGRLRAHVFPTSPIDGLLLSGYTGEVWLEPGVTDAQARAQAGLGQRRPAEPAGVGLVLGAGNITAIPVLDVLYELIANNRVVILKLNPTQDALAHVYARALAPLIEPGLLRIVQGGGDVGAYLTTHPGIDHVHITGSAATFDVIAPTLSVPITAELGGVSPIIIVPGVWTDADLTFHAEHVATMRLQNSGHNCIAGQVVILSSDWPQRAAFLEALHRA